MKKNSITLAAILAFFAITTAIAQQGFGTSNPAPSSGCRYGIG